jgi:tetratricopeptide (TPR) repeat protein
MASVPQQQAKQETYRNPAMEEQDEFHQALNKGRLLMHDGDVDGAVKEFRKAATLKNGQCAECFNFIAQAYFADGRYKDAAIAYKQTIALKPDNEAELNNALGVCIYLQDDKKTLEEAVTAFNRAIEMSSGKLVKVYYNLGYALLKLGREAEGKAALTRYLELDPGTNTATEVRALIANPRMVNERFAPGFKVKSFDGSDLSLEEYRGRIVLLDFWATWCGPCRVEMPETKNIWKRFGGDKFVIIGVSLDRNKKALESYLKSEEIGWPQYFDESGDIARLYGVRGIPHTVLIDQNGVVRWVGYRGGKLESKVEEMVNKLRKQPN